MQAKVTKNSLSELSRMSPAEIMGALRQDACSFAYIHVIKSSLVEQWKATYLPAIEQSVLPGRWFMMHPVYTLIAPKEIVTSGLTLRSAKALAYKDLGELSNSAIAAFALKPGARWYDDSTADGQAQMNAWAISCERWDEFAFAKTRGQNNLYNSAREAHLFTKGGFAGKLGYYPILRNVKQIARAVIFVPNEANNRTTHRKIVIENQ